MERLEWGSEVCKDLGKDDWYRWNSQCNDPEAGTCLVHLETSVAGAE